MGQKPTEEELFQMISEVDDNMSGSIGTLHAPVYLSRLCCVVHESSCGWCMEHTHADFGEFLKVIEKQKERAAQFDDESDMSRFHTLLSCGECTHITTVAN